MAYNSLMKTFFKSLWEKWKEKITSRNRTSKKGSGADTVALYYFSITLSFGNHFMLIWCSFLIDISYNYQCWKQLFSLMFLQKLWYICHAVVERSARFRKLLTKTVFIHKANTGERRRTQPWNHLTIQVKNTGLKLGNQGRNRTGVHSQKKKSQKLSLGEVTLSKGTPFYLNSAY